VRRELTTLRGVVKQDRDSVYLTRTRWSERLSIIEATLDRLGGSGVDVAQEIARQLMGLLHGGALDKLEELAAEIRAEADDGLTGEIHPDARDESVTGSPGCGYYREATDSALCTDPGCDRCNPRTGPLPTLDPRWIPRGPRGHTSSWSRATRDYPRALVRCPTMPAGYVTTTPYRPLHRVRAPGHPHAPAGAGRRLGEALPPRLGGSRA